MPFEHPAAGESLQRKYAPDAVCFGCGPSNDDGLHIESFVDGDEIVASFTPSEHHNAFPGVLNGGMVGVLLDCHCNWAAAWHLMKANDDGVLPSTVTAEYTIRMRHPTPMGETLRLRACVVSSEGRRVVVEGEIVAGEKVTASCEGTFVAVKPGHPAYHRW